MRGGSAVAGAKCVSHKQVRGTDKEERSKLIEDGKQDVRVANAVLRQLDKIDRMVTRTIVGSMARPRDSDGYICDRGAGESAAPCMLDLIPILKDLLAPLRAKSEFEAIYSELQAALYSREESELANKWERKHLPQREYIQWVLSEDKHRVEEARHDQRQQEVITAIQTAANSPTELVTYNSEHVMLAVSQPYSFFKMDTEDSQREAATRSIAQDVNDVFDSIRRNAPPASLTPCIQEGLVRLQAICNEMENKRNPTPAGSKLHILYDDLVCAVKLAALYRNKAPQSETDRHNLLRAMSANAYVITHDMSYADAEDLVKESKTNVRTVTNRLLLYCAPPEVSRLYRTPPEKGRAQPAEEGEEAERADGERFWHRARESHKHTQAAPHVLINPPATPPIGAGSRPRPDLEAVSREQQRLSYREEVLARREAEVASREMENARETAALEMLRAKLLHANDMSGETTPRRTRMNIPAAPPPPPASTAHPRNRR